MANLASVIMEGANVGSVCNDTGFDFSNSATFESSYLDSAVATLFTDIMEADMNYMVADVVGAATVIRESKLGNEIDAVAVTEGVIKNGIDRLVNAFKKFIQKIKDWYQKVIQWFKAMFSNAEDFEKNYGKELKTKASKTKGYTYTGWKYTRNTGDALVEKICKATEAEINNYIDKGFDVAKTSLSKSELLDKMKSKLDVKFDEDKQTSAGEVVDNFIMKEFKYSDLAEMREDIIEKYHDGDTAKVQIKDFEGNSVTTMLDYLKTSSKTIAKFERDRDKFEKAVNKVINNLNKFESGDKDGDLKDNQVSHASYIASIISGLLNAFKVPCDAQITILKAMSTEWLGALKGFYRYKGVKESFEMDAESIGLLESSFVMEGKDEEDDEPAGDDSDKGSKEEGTTESVVAGILEQAAAFL